jgi:hypothetical protein
LISKAAKEIEAARYRRGKRIATEPRKGGDVTTHGQHAYDIASVGGVAFLVDVLNFVYTIFETDHISGALMMSSMQPEKLSANEFTIFKICHKMLRLGKDHEIVYAGMDLEGVGAVTFD